MKTINKPLENMGGLIKMWALPYDSYSENNGAVTMLDDTDIVEIYCSQDSMRLIESADVKDAGLFYDTMLSGFSPGNSDTARNTFKAMNNRKFAVLFLSGNGSWYLAGAPLYPLRFISSFNSGENSADRAGHFIQFSGDTFEPAIPVSNPF